MIKSLGKPQRKDKETDKYWKTTTQMDKEGLVKNISLNIENSKISHRNT